MYVILFVLNMNRMQQTVRKKKSPFYHTNTKQGGMFTFEYSYSNENLVVGETFEREVHSKFNNLAMFKIIYPCIPYLLTGGKLLFSNGGYDSWAVRVGEMKIEPDTKIESMDEDYEYLLSDPDSSQPFQVARVGHYSITGDGGCDMFVFLSFNKDDGGLLIPVQIKMRSTENMKIYDPNNVYEEGYKTLNHYLTDFDNLLSRMILDKNENNWTTRYGIYVVNSNVHVPERYPHTKNVIMVLRDFEITVDNIREFFNRIRARNHNRETQNIRSRYSVTDTMINKTERSILVTQTDIMERLLRECDDEKTWLEKKNMLMRAMQDTINEVRISINDNQDDRTTSRYEQEYETRMQKYDLSNVKHVTKTNTLENSEKKDAFDMKDLVKSLESSRETEKEFDMLRLLRSINNK